MEMQQPPGPPPMQSMHHGCLYGLSNKKKLNDHSEWMSKWETPYFGIHEQMMMANLNCGRRRRRNKNS